MRGKVPASRLVVGLTVAAILAGCAAGATVAPPSASRAPATATSGAAIASVPSSPTASPTSAAAASPPQTQIPTIGAPADDGARTTAVATVDARTRDLTIESPAVGVVKVRLLLPTRFEAQPKTRWPVLYLLHPAMQTHGFWTSSTDVAALTAPTGLLVVMPDGGDWGNYTDWWNGGQGGPPKWETFHLVELRQLLERNWQAGERRAVAGASMGGLGAMAYAARQPGTFLAAASYSGGLDLLGGAAFLTRLMAAFDASPTPIWGDPVAQADVWLAHDPIVLAPALEGTQLFVSYGDGTPGPLEVSASPNLDPTGEAEAGIAIQNRTFVQRLGQLKIPATVDAYAGTHNIVYWERALHRSLPLLVRAVGG